ncbi:hypothetical protein HLH44_17285 [Gluconacetobacter sp. 1c LMG 22058]|uniref:Uncharacterized protein n=1 Tax=Gluconacetobacter dulcium TaxID=2729096 RepID=A0A7W4K2G3_9PROT|nr:hypothetical protein [Gluconacetobacter dulcium]MBB2199169.1 hypothetical protein [Gluconacetobacter dulcium]
MIARSHRLAHNRVPEGNCVDHVICKGQTFLDHGIEDDETLARDGDKNDLGCLAFGAHPIARGDECGHAGKRGQGCDIENFANF